MAKKSSTENKPAEKVVATTPRRRSGKAYSKPKARKTCNGKTILGIKRNRFIEEILTVETDKRVSELRKMHPVDLKALIESTVAILRARKRERRGRGQAGRFQNYKNGPGRPRSEKDAQLRRAAQLTQTTKVTRLLDEAVVAATAIGKMRGTKSNAEVQDAITKMRGELIQETSAAVIRNEMDGVHVLSIDGLDGIRILSIDELLGIDEF